LKLDEIHGRLALRAEELARGKRVRRVTFPTLPSAPVPLSVHGR
jgi:hypothetical protein